MMSIAKTLEQNLNRLDALLKRKNGDIEEAGPKILDDMRGDITALKNLEAIAPINQKLFYEYNREGIYNDPNN